MTTARPLRPVRLALLVAGLAIGLTAVIALGLGMNSGEPSSAPSEAAAIASATVGSPAAGATASTPSIRCRRDPGSLPSYLADDPCPTAILAVELAVATVRLPIAQMVVEPGPMYCDMVWEGYDTPAPCRGAAVRPGQFMHAYVAFTSSPKVGVVMLGLDLPEDDTAPAATRPPWHTTLVTVDVPPAGWVMP